MAEQPFLTLADVAEIGEVEKRTVSRYLTRSRPGQPYADDPFPAPDGLNGKSPWWSKRRRKVIEGWFERHRDRAGVGGRPRKDAGS
ncbi:hypothetical protein [Phytohabitans houttuyneae]|uniref:hypothetical protein n=1 Tax=Phytohabitans houttuyneae TaxID=1076126 RepID=UPI0015636EBA|nr:hypothetical protein [Phytohabitans houttuyneae]